MFDYPIPPLIHGLYNELGETSGPITGRRRGLYSPLGVDLMGPK